MERFRAPLLALAASALCILAALSAQAQGICQMGQPTPKVVSGSSYILRAQDSCGYLVFSGGGPVQVTNDQTAVQSFMVMLTSTGGSVTVTPAAGMATVNSQPSIQLMQYQPMTLISDGSSNYWLFAGGPVPAQNTSFGQPAIYSTPGLVPGTIPQNTPVVVMPGIPEFNTPGAWQANPRAPAWFELCRGAPATGDGSIAPTVGKLPTWLHILDYLSQPRFIPVC